MENKEFKITVPDGYEIDKENSTFECIKFKKKGSTYREICRALFLGKDTFDIQTAGSIGHMIAKGDDVYSSNNASSIHQLEQLLAINKLMNVARYLNEKTLNWDDKNKAKWAIVYNHDGNYLSTSPAFYVQRHQAYFDSDSHARQAIEILGEDTIKQAIGVFE